MSSTPPPAKPPVSTEYRPEKFMRTTGPRDYLVYAMLVVLAAVLLGAAGYYLTRTEAEQKRIVAALRGITGGEENQMRPAKLREPKIADQMEVAPPAPATKPGGGASAGPATTATAGPVSRVLPSEDASRPVPGPGFVQFAEGLRVNSVVQGSPVRAILNGRMVRVGEELNPELAVTLADVDLARKFVLLRDRSGAELRVTY